MNKVVRLGCQGSIPLGINRPVQITLVFDSFIMIIAKKFEGTTARARITRDGG
jgi:hypothetical protein